MRAKKIGEVKVEFFDGSKGAKISIIGAVRARDAFLASRKVIPAYHRWKREQAKERHDGRTESNSDE